MQAIPRTRRLVFSGRRQKDRDPARYCFMCGAPLAGRTHRLIHVVNGGLDVLHPDDESLYESDPGDMYFFHIGPACARALGADWTQPW